MSKKSYGSWRAWGQYRIERELRKGFSHRKNFWKEEEVNSVFVIISEWTDNKGNTSSEIVDAKFYESENEAWSDLQLIAAESFGIELGIDETSFTYEDPSAMVPLDEYYIQELTK